MKQVELVESMKMARDDPCRTSIGTLMSQSLMPASKAICFQAFSGIAESQCRKTEIMAGWCWGRCFFLVQL
jgi:hypothetical protein